MNVVAGVMLCLALIGAGENELLIGSFDQPKNQPRGWDTYVYGGRGQFHYEDSGRNGSRCVAIESESGGDMVWFTRVAVEPYSKYRLSCWIKTENVTLDGGRGALINLHQMEGAVSNAITGTRDWTQVAFEFDTSDDDTIQINCLLGGWGRAMGKAWYDDVELQRIGSKQLSPAVVLDATKIGHPISKYIYGQFIEHLGRCIYGGIWAEMIEDRKFFYAVGERESPWTPVGDDTVEMVRDGSYVGEHTPRIGAGGGIVQSGLGLLEGKSYVGRIVLAGSGKVTVSLTWGDGLAQTVSFGDLTSEFVKYPLSFQAGGTTDEGRIEIRGSEPFLLGTISMMPADNVNGMRADTLALLRELNSPIYRWPGGNFVSGYDWQDGIGDPDRRPPRKNPAWLGVEHNDFGAHEFMAFCDAIGTEPYVTVNSGQGDVQLARDEVEYFNGRASTLMGNLRDSNGREDPWNVKYWSIGNEMYGDWQLGHMPLENYVRKHNEFAEAMRKVDPEIELVAVGATGKWSETMLAECADHMELLSEHFYCGEKPNVIAHVRQIADNVRGKADAHRRYWATIPAMKRNRIPVTLDEWNYWYGPHVFGELGTRYFLKDGLGVAAGIHEFTRQSDVMFMANYAQTVNVIGAIKTTKTHAAFESTGLMLKLYRNQYGTWPIDVSGNTAPLDVAAAWTDDRDAITVGIVNPLSSTIKVAMSIQGARLNGTGTLWRMKGDDPMAYNHPGEAPAIEVAESAADLPADGVLSVSAFSVSLYRFPADPE